MISKYSEKVVFQTSSAEMDSYGNWVTSWQDLYTCHANVNSLYGSEYYAAAETNSQDSMDFTVRYCLLLMNIDTTSYRIIFHEKVYNIEHVDFLSFKKKEIKIKAKLEDRDGESKDR